MPQALGHFVLLVFSAVISMIGVAVTRKPEATLRIFTFGGPAFGQRFGAAWFRGVGWVFAVVFGAGTLFYATMTLIDLAR